MIFKFWGRNKTSFSEMITPPRVLWIVKYVLNERHLESHVESVVVLMKLGCSTTPAAFHFFKTSSLRFIPLITVPRYSYPSTKRRRLSADVNVLMAGRFLFREYAACFHIGSLYLSDSPVNE